ncbi:hypothetical protein FHS04_002779 [Mesoflavibacter sabulilitoris]|uniref:Conjugative transposon TraJ C-terminal domain-containing protein n=1 Tax=Mesoflavibacter zeaxanthinifaciens subsp. sabulilitoris TaxID=1520893 RepID=A0A2T1NNJ7_9FLAO|nr:type IV secretion system protein [Mesoflavibacter zeaxanthinifaciens]MBB3125235.1 hypothetical protein [Mesoflavibacter zeaxanthinifaciens subsp. sabulilitoris]PSG94470.1 hypothetical protein C7H61_00625 [Mesoflavibacter zeaxanthinifaciens subsp. sabulilitoris]
MQDLGIREQVSDIVDSFIDNAFIESAVMMNIGRTFAGIGIVIITLKLFLDKEKRVDIFEALKWVPLVFLLLKYKSFVGAIYGFYTGLGEAFANNVYTWDNITEILNATAEDVNASWFIEDFIYVLILIINAISIVVFVAIKAMASIYLYVLIVFGPLNIGLSLIPALSGMWKAWLQKFMSVALWIPMLYLIDNFMLKITFELIIGLLEEGNLAKVLTSSAVILMNVFMYLKVPDLSNFVVQGMNVSTEKVRQKGKKAVGQAGKAATAARKAVTGGL